MKTIPQIEKLTPRQKEVVKLVGDGFTDKAVGIELGISTETAEYHLAQAKKRLGAKDRAGVIKRAFAEGLSTL